MKYIVIFSLLVFSLFLSACFEGEVGFCESCVSSSDCQSGLDCAEISSTSGSRTRYCSLCVPDYLGEGDPVPCSCD